MTPKFPELRSQFDALQKERAELAAKAAPLRERYNALAKQIAPVEAEMRELANQFKAIEQPRLAELDNQIGALARAMGGRSIKHGG